MIGEFAATQRSREGGAAITGASSPRRVHEPGAGSAGAPLLSLRHVSVAYEHEGRTILHDVNFTIHPGEAVLLMGPSGCGKSTLAMLCAQLIPRSVEAVVQGEVVVAPALQEPGQIGYVFQDPDSQFCMLEVADEVAFGLENRAVPHAAMPRSIAAALHRSGSDVPHHAQHALFSGGMKQKLAIACALVHDPLLLVLDEPTANLDPLSTRQVFDQIAALHDASQTLLVIEHKFDALLDIMDRVVLFDRNGHIYREGPPLEIVRAEWEWLVQEGVVAAWKSPPGVEGAGHVQHAAMAHPPVTACEPVTSPGSRNEAQLPFGHISPVPVPVPVPVLSLIDATIAYRDRTVLEHLTLNIGQGDFVAIVGPNGAGKSSLLQLLAGLTKPRSGAVSLLGKPMRQWKPKERFGAIAYSFQNPEFQFIYERVGDELANRILGRELPERVRDLLLEFGLQGLEQQSPFALSQGQKRRLSVAAMLRDEHELYLFDEPTFGQDARTQLAILEQMRTLNQCGKTIVLTTHDMNLVRQYAKHVLVLAAGQILFTGTPAQLFDRDDIQRAAHLLADQTQGTPVVARLSSLGDHHDVTPAAAQLNTDRAHDTQQVAEDATSVTHTARPRTRRKSPVQRLNPAWLFTSMLAAAVISLSAHTLHEALAQLALPLIVMMALGWMSPWRIIRLLSPFLFFYVLYFWTYVANSTVPPGAPSYHLLWYNLSWVGVHNGLILSIRMLGSVLFGILFVTQIDITEFMVALTRNFRVPPRFAYGAMAGLRVVPLFSSEWTKLRQARQIRSRESTSPMVRVITYALPLLSQGIRMSERVAIAMEARGFVGAPAASAKGRTFYREVVVHWWDYAVSLSIVVLSLLGALAIH